MTERAANRLPQPVDVLELDVERPEDFEALTAELRSRWGGVDGALHAIAFAPEDALGGNFLRRRPRARRPRSTTSAVSLQDARRGARAADGGRRVASSAWTSTPQVAWPVYDWMGVAKAALEATSTATSRATSGRSASGSTSSRAGPARDRRRARHPGLRRTSPTAWREQAPLGWDTDDPGPVAGRSASCSPTSPARSPAQILKVDGGFSAMGAAGLGRPPRRR